MNATPGADTDCDRVVSLGLLLLRVLLTVKVVQVGDRRRCHNLFQGPAHNKHKTQMIEIRSQQMVRRKSIKQLSATYLSCRSTILVDLRFAFAFLCGTGGGDNDIDLSLEIHSHILGLFRIIVDYR